MSRRAAGSWLPFGHGRAEEGSGRMGSPEQPVQDENVKSEQHQRTEIEQVLGDATRLDVGEVPERLDVGRIREPHDTHDQTHTEHEDHAGQTGTPAPWVQLAIWILLELRRPAVANRRRSPR